MSAECYIEPTEAAGRALAMRGLTGPVVMLNLLRFREIADYSNSPELAPAEPISGAAAYQRYAEHTRPLLAVAGGEVLFMGETAGYLIGPADARWDLVLLVRHRSVADLLAFASDADYLAGKGHRTAALADSRLLPMSGT
jgi:uncharacterized protein (DUF1330 family)